MRKYLNNPTIYKERRYDSQKEAKHAMFLDMCRKAAHSDNRVVCYFPQVPFKFACGSRMIVDFVVCYADNHYEIHEVKGGEVTKTSTYRLKKRMLKNEYGLGIKEV